MRIKTAFTLLELIIVIIIVGVLASLSFPRFFSMIERARSVEALTNIKIFRQAVERCYLIHNGSYATCTYPSASGNNLGMEDYVFAAPYHFGYIVAAVGQGYLIEALRNPAVDPLMSTPAWSFTCGTSTHNGSGAVIVLCDDGVGNISITGYGHYSGMRW